MTLFILLTCSTSQNNRPLRYIRDGSGMSSDTGTQSKWITDGTRLTQTDKNNNKLSLISFDDSVDYDKLTWNEDKKVLQYTDSDGNIWDTEWDGNKWVLSGIENKDFKMKDNKMSKLNNIWYSTDNKNWTLTADDKIYILSEPTTEGSNVKTLTNNKDDEMWRTLEDNDIWVINKSIDYSLTKYVNDDDSTMKYKDMNNALINKDNSKSMVSTSGILNKFNDNGELVNIFDDCVYSPETIKDNTNNINFIKKADNEYDMYKDEDKNKIATFAVAINNTVLQLFSTIDSVPPLETTGIDTNIKQYNTRYANIAVKDFIDVIEKTVGSTIEIIKRYTITQNTNSYSLQHAKEYTFMMNDEKFIISYTYKDGYTTYTITKDGDNNKLYTIVYKGSNLYKLIQASKTNVVLASIIFNDDDSYDIKIGNKGYLIKFNQITNNYEITHKTDDIYIITLSANDADNKYTVSYNKYTSTTIDSITQGSTEYTINYESNVYTIKQGSTEYTINYESDKYTIKQGSTELAKSQTSVYIYINDNGMYFIGKDSSSIYTIIQGTTTYTIEYKNNVYTIKQGSTTYTIKSDLSTQEITYKIGSSNTLTSGHKHTLINNYNLQYDADSNTFTLDPTITFSTVTGGATLTVNNKFTYSKAGTNGKEYVFNDDYSKEWTLKSTINYNFEVGDKIVCTNVEDKKFTLDPTITFSTVTGGTTLTVNNKFTYKKAGTNAKEYVFNDASSNEWTFTSTTNYNFEVGDEIVCTNVDNKKFTLTRKGIKFTSIVNNDGNNVDVTKITNPIYYIAYDDMKDIFTLEYTDTSNSVVQLYATIAKKYTIETTKLTNTIIYDEDAKAYTITDKDANTYTVSQSANKYDISNIIVSLKDASGILYDINDNSKVITFKGYDATYTFTKISNSVYKLEHSVDNAIYEFDGIEGDYKLTKDTTTESYKFVNSNDDSIGYEFDKYNEYTFKDDYSKEWTLKSTINYNFEVGDEIVCTNADSNTFTLDPTITFSTVTGGTLNINDKFTYERAGTSGKTYIFVKDSKEWTFESTTDYNFEVGDEIVCTNAEDKKFASTITFSSVTPPEGETLTKEDMGVTPTSIKFASRNADTEYEITIIRPLTVIVGTNLLTNVKDTTYLFKFDNTNKYWTIDDNRCEITGINSIIEKTFDNNNRLLWTTLDNSKSTSVADWSWLPTDAKTYQLNTNDNSWELAENNNKHILSIADNIWMYNLFDIKDNSYSSWLSCMFTSSTDTQTPSSEVDTKTPSSEVDTQTPSSEVDTKTPSSEVDTQTPSSEVEPVPTQSPTPLSEGSQHRDYKTATPTQSPEPIISSSSEVIDTEPEESNGLSTGAIVGIVIGCSLGAALITFAIIHFVCKQCNWTTKFSRPSKTDIMP